MNVDQFLDDLILALDDRAPGTPVTWGELQEELKRIKRWNS